MTMPETARNMYDTHAAIRRLTEAGLPEPHAEAMVAEQVHLMEHNLATKADIAAVQGNIEAVQANLKAVQADIKADIEKQRLETKADIEKHQLETKADIEKHQLETKADIEKLRLETGGKIEAAKTELIKWMIGANISGVALIVAALKLL